MYKHPSCARHVLALNVGSTSVKSKVFSLSGESEKEAFSWSKANLDPKASHEKAFLEFKAELSSRGFVGKIVAVGHRVVHGGHLKQSLRIGSRELKIMGKYSDLAPLHNPYNILGIKEAVKLFGRKIPQVAVFDTAFFSNLPSHASTYPIPEKYIRKYGLYRYGFHGISHNYSMLEAARLFKRPVNKLKLITIHLGGGASITAIDQGVAIDTSMGFTPLEGLMMGTRSGDIDPGIIFYLANVTKLSLWKLKNILVNESGVYGLCGAKNMLELLNRVEKNDKRAKLAFEIYAYRIRKYIGAYFAVLGGCDALVFTGAIGSGDAITRKKVVTPLKQKLLRNTKVIAILPNEEKMIAREVKKLLNI